MNIEWKEDDYGVMTATAYGFGLKAYVGWRRVWKGSIARGLQVIDFRTGLDSLEEAKAWCEKTLQEKRASALAVLEGVPAEDYDRLKEAARPGLLRLMEDMSENGWCAGWLSDLDRRLIAGNVGQMEGFGFTTEEFDNLALALGEVYHWPEEGRGPEIRPLTEEEKATIRARVEDRKKTR